jgi:hypothetical protein
MSGNVDSRVDPLEAKGEPIAALALARGATLTEAAEEAGIGPRTLRRRLDVPAYRAEIARLRSKVLDETWGRLLLGARLAVDTLIDVASNGTTELTKVSADRILIEHAFSFAELVGVNDRLAAVKDAVAEARRPALPLPSEE